jgi:hypothetical protein
MPQDLEQLRIRFLALFQAADNLQREVMLLNKLGEELGMSELRCMGYLEAIQDLLQGKLSDALKKVDKL